MRDHDGKPRREAGRFLRPIGQQRSGSHEQARRLYRLLASASVEGEQQRENLNRLAKTHVVGEARAQTEPGQKMQPLQSGLLIRPQCRLQRSAGIDAGEAFRAAASLKRLFEPRASLHMRPLGAGRSRSSSIEIGARQQPHGLRERHALGRRQLFDCVEPVEGRSQSRRVDLDPFAAQQRQTMR